MKLRYLFQQFYMQLSIAHLMVGYERTQSEVLASLTSWTIGSIPVPELLKALPLPNIPPVSSTLADASGLVCCLNSLYKIGALKAYNVMILDEMALIWWTFLSQTMKNKFESVLDTMRHLLRKANLVVLVQESFSWEDVNFYTLPCGVDPDDRRYVFARKYIKKIVHHPIIYTRDYRGRCRGRFLKVWEWLLHRLTQNLSDSDLEDLRRTEHAESALENMVLYVRKYQILQTYHPRL